MTTRNPELMGDYETMITAQVVVGALTQGATKPVEEAEANARLIAAAPELLEELRKQVKYMVRVNPLGEESKTVQSARAAISKAEGK